VKPIGTEDEEQKLKWLQGAIQAVYDSKKAWKHEQEQEILEVHKLSGWTLEWDQIIRFVFPEIVLIMSDDRRALDRHPVFACFPRTGDWVTLPTETEADLDKQQDGNPTLAERHERASLSLKAVILELPEARRGEAMKHLRALERIIRPAV